MRPGLKGDLSATPLADVLTELATTGATGCLHIDDDAGDEALVYVKSGRVYAAHVPGRRPQLGARLISSGALAPEALEEALEAQATELQGWRLGELLVHLGYVERPVVEAFVLEQLREAAFDLSRWTAGRYKFRKAEKTREDVGSHAEVADLLAEVARRREEWEVIAGVVHGPTAVPVLSAGGIASAEMTLDQDQWALLCKVDGERTVAQLARDCGFTTFEAGQIVYSLVGAGLLDVEETFTDELADVPPPGDTGPTAAAIASALAPAEPDAGTMAMVQRISSALFMPLVPGEAAVEDVPDVAEHGELARLLAPADEPDELSGEFPLVDLPSLRLPPTLEPEFPALPEPEPEPVVAEPAPPVAGDDPFGDSLARVSEALSALLGDALPVVSLPEAAAPAGPTAEEIAAAAAEAERLERSRAAAAAELAEAHAHAEAEHRQRAEGSRVRRGRDRRAAEEAERLAAEEEAARVAAEETAARAAEEEFARLAAAEAERLAAAEAERLAAAEAERLAAEETARAAAEEAERRAAEAAAQAELAEAPVAEEVPEEALDTFDVTALLRDINADPVPDTVETIEEFEPFDVADDDEVDEPPPADPAPAAPAYANGSRAGLSETAALLRELTSLGLDDDEPAAPAARLANAATPKSAPKEQPKKRKGLFGRS